MSGPLSLQMHRDEQAASGWVDGAGSRILVRSLAAQAPPGWILTELCSPRAVALAADLLDLGGLLQPSVLGGAAGTRRVISVVDAKTGQGTICVLRASAGQWVLDQCWGPHGTSGSAQVRSLFVTARPVDAVSDRFGFVPPASVGVLALLVETLGAAEAAAGPLAAGAMATEGAVALGPVALVLGGGVALVIGLSTLVSAQSYPWSQDQEAWITEMEAVQAQQQALGLPALGGCGWVLSPLTLFLRFLQVFRDRVVAANPKNLSPQAIDMLLVSAWKKFQAEIQALRSTPISMADLQARVGVGGGGSQVTHAVLGEVAFSLAVYLRLLGDLFEVAGVPKADVLVGLGFSAFQEEWKRCAGIVESAVSKGGKGGKGAAAQGPVIGVLRSTSRMLEVAWRLARFLLNMPLRTAGKVTRWGTLLILGDYVMQEWRQVVDTTGTDGVGTDTAWDVFANLMQHASTLRSYQTQTGSRWEVDPAGGLRLWSTSSGSLGPGFVPAGIYTVQEGASGSSETPAVRTAAVQLEVANTEGTYRAVRRSDGTWGWIWIGPSGELRSLILSADGRWRLSSAPVAGTPPRPSAALSRVPSMVPKAQPPPQAPVSLDGVWTSEVPGIWLQDSAGRSFSPGAVPAGTYSLWRSDAQGRPQEAEQAPGVPLLVSVPAGSRWSFRCSPSGCAFDRDAGP